MGWWCATTSSSPRSGGPSETCWRTGSSLAGTGRRGQSAGIRGDATRWLERTDPEPVVAILDGFEHLRVGLATQLRLPLRRFEVQGARYPKGAGYAPHRDTFRRDPGRLVTAIAYLNPNWQPEHGGKLRAWVSGSQIDVDPVLGRLVLFRSDTVLHEVSRARRPRFAVTAWYCGVDHHPVLGT